MTIDKATLQILADHCAAAAEAMAFTLMRTSHSTFVKETEDFSCGLLTPDGVTFASPRTLGATWYVGLDYGPAIRAIAEYEEGDICVTNDPYSGFVATHPPDMHIWKPVFWNGEIVCFVAGHIHNTDVGGAVPASLSRSLTEVYQEGIRIPPTKLFAKGVLDQRLLDILSMNVRQPEQNRGDLMAQIASVATGERRVLEMIERFGIDTFRRGIDGLLDYAAEQAAAIVRTIPDGTYFHSEYADEDSDDGYPCRLAVTMTVSDGSIVLDFTGSDPQLGSSLNVPTGGRERHVLPTVGFVYALYTLARGNLILNAGIMRVVRCILPEGTIVNPVMPAAVGMRSLTCATLQTLLIGVFSLACPERFCAGPAGGRSIMNVKTSTRDGRPIMASIGPVGGGGGGMPDADGEDGAGANGSFLRNTPVEINEVEVPIRILRYGLEPDSGGAGRYRGGLGVTMDFQVFAPDTLVTARNRDCSRFTSFGIRGGRGGAPSRFIRNPDGAKPDELGNRDVVKCLPGDIIRITGAGAGGYGDPMLRDPRAVLEDVRAGYVSPARALSDYGVVIADGAVDEAATKAERATRTPPPAGRHFDAGPAREAYERVWTRERYDALTALLAALPVNWRFFLKHRIFEAMEAEAGSLPAGAAAIDALYARMRARYRDLPAV